MSSLELTNAPEFTPPRAGKWGRWLGRHRWYALRRVLWLDRLDVRRRIRLPRALLIAALVPGAGFGRLGRKILRGSVALAAVLAVVCVIWIGRPLGSLAFMGLVSLHVSSFLFAIEPLLGPRSLARRLLVSIAIMVCFWVLLYLPCRRFVETHLVTPYRYHDKLVLMQPAGAHAAGLRPGDIVTFEMGGARGGNIVVREAINIGMVVGLPGDRIQFAKGRYYRNGMPHPSLAHMPSSGQVVLEKDQWYVWPEVSIRGNPNTSVSDALAGEALVDEPEIKGRVFRRWFFWRQY